MSAVRSESDKFVTSFTNVHGQDGYNENDVELNTSVRGNDVLVLRHVESGDNTVPDDESRNADGCERLFYLNVPPTADDHSILAGLGREIWHVCVWDVSRSQLTFEGGPAAPSHLDRSDMEWARLQIYSKPSRSGSIATEQDICDVARRITGELSGIERSRVPVSKGKPSKVHYAVARGHNVGIYHHFSRFNNKRTDTLALCSWLSLIWTRLSSGLTRTARCSWAQISRLQRIHRFRDWRQARSRTLSQRSRRARGGRQRYHRPGLQ